MLVEWPEIIPAHEEEAGLTMQFDAPGAQAPQAVLLAVPPDAQPNWSYDALERTLLDTLESGPDPCPRPLAPRPLRAGHPHDLPG